MTGKWFHVVSAFLLGAALFSAPCAEGGLALAKKKKAPVEAVGQPEPIDTLLGTTQRGGSTLVGTFYDLKQTPKGTATDVAANPHKTWDVVKSFLEKNWSKGVLSKYFQAKTRLHASSIYVPQIAASYVPDAFQCADRVKDGSWIVIYRGMVRAPKTGKFRFVGGGDEVIAVRFNGKTVLEWGYEVPTFGFSGNQSRGQGPFQEGLRKMQAKGYGHVIRYRRGDDPANPMAGGFERFCNEVGLIEGIPFEVQKGKTYPIEILISEFGGGASGYFLLIEEMGAQQPKVKSGAKLYHLFRTDDTLPTHDAILQKVQDANKKAGKNFNGGWGNDNMEGVPFDEESLIWTVVQ